MDTVQREEGGSDDDDEEEFEESEEEEDASEDETGTQAGPSRPTSPLASIHDGVASVSLADTPDTVGNPSNNAPEASDLAKSDEEPESSDVSEEDEMKTRVVNEITKTRARQQKKYHSKKSTGRAGRTKGSKAKQDTRVKLDSGGWY
jgi:RIO kinase 2